MKKLLVMLLSVIALASCASNMQERNDEEEKPVAVETMKETEKRYNEKRNDFQFWK